MRFHILKESDYRTGTKYEIYSDDQLIELYNDEKEDTSDDEIDDKSANEIDYGTDCKILSVAEGDTTDDADNETDDNGTSYKTDEKKRNDVPTKKHNDIFTEIDDGKIDDNNNNNEKEISIDQVIEKFNFRYFDNFDFETSKFYDLLLIYGSWDDIKIYKIGQYDDFDEAEKFCKYTFYKIHNCKPFVSTGMTCAYKETGHYPELEEDLKIIIKNLNFIQNPTNWWEIIDDIERSELCIGVICCDQQVDHMMQFCPLF